MYVRTSVIAFLTLFGAACVSHADDAPIFSGPQVGETLPPLKVSLAYGEEAGQIVDFVELAADRPMLLVIVNGANRPAAGLTRCVMNFAEMREDDLFAGVVYLDNDLSAAETYLRQATSWWGMGPPVGVSVDGAEGPGSYGLNRNVNLTILVAHKGRVTSNFALVQPSLTDAPAILSDVVALAGGRVPTQAELTFLSASTRRPRGAPWHGAPSDVRMRALICDALAAGDEDAARAAAEKIEAFVGDDPDRRAILGNAAALLLDRRQQYATAVDGPIAVHLQRWRDETGGGIRRRR
jgi:hypothetical protein